jgi:hypothetical protein
MKYSPLNTAAYLLGKLPFDTSKEQQFLLGFEILKDSNLGILDRTAAIYKAVYKPTRPY